MSIKPCYHGHIKIGDKMIDITDMEIVEVHENAQKTYRARVAIVDGSLVQPVTDPSRLIEEKKPDA